MLYTDRLRLESQAQGRRHRSWRERLFHSRRRCRHSRLAPEDGDTRWKCCSQWHRKLTNKWNSRSFAVRHGCRVPELYWHGTDVDALPLSELPEAYVVRPMLGTALSRGTCAMSNGRNLMNDRVYSIGDLREELRETTRSRGPRHAPLPLLVEEFITDREGESRLPIEYKCYVFGENVAAIEVNRRLLRNSVQRGAFRPDWTSIPGGIRAEGEPLSPDVPPPPCLEELLACAGRLGKALERHVRADFFAPATGPVFGELTFWAHGATGFNDFAEEYFAEQWTRAYPISQPRA